jgi:hypothetical protein
MKKFILSLCISLLIILSKLEAQEYTHEPYIVGSFKHHTMKHQKGFGDGQFKQAIPGIELCLGTKIYPGLEIEAGSHLSHRAGQGDNKSKVVSTFGRAIGSMEFYDGVDFLIGGGLSMTNFDYSPAGKDSIIVRKIVPHIMIGAKLKFTDWLTLRPMLSLEGTKNKKHQSIRQSHAHALHLGVVTYF